MREPHNKARGETLLDIGGRQARLCLTLGALAELEAAFDAVSLAELGERLTHLTAADLITVLASLTRGGGEAMSVAQISDAGIDPRAAATAVAQAFSRALDD
jgi:hypothetical protein